MKIGRCVGLPDGRVGRVRERTAQGYRIPVQRKTSRTHEFVVIAADKLEFISCPQGWMSPEGYNRYLKATLVKMRKRLDATSKMKR